MASHGEHTVVIFFLPPTNLEQLPMREIIVNQRGTINLPQKPPDENIPGLSLATENHLPSGEMLCWCTVRFTHAATLVVALFV